MEALLEKEGAVDSWNDERLDELAGRMDKGFEEAATKVELTALKNEVNVRFDRVDERFTEVNRRFGEVDQRLDRIDNRLLRIDSHLGRMNNTLLVAAFGVIAALIANGFAG
jgi:hypothetical protein